MMNEVKNLEGSVSTKTCLADLLSFIDSLGDLWRHTLIVVNVLLLKAVTRLNQLF